ncbi:MAG: FG-GAP repeat protein [Planctomycetes bacterium]|nr:FG-GAP repeat protein [Planctomycetota bacterium]
MSPKLRIIRIPVHRQWPTVLLAMSVFALASPGAAQVWGQWEQTHKLTADDAAAGNRLGISVSISGGITIVGAFADDDACPGDYECSSGSAYLFNATTGEQHHKLIAEDTAEGDSFGWSVSISGDSAIVGAPFDDDNGGNSGSAYVFRRDQDGAENWGEVRKLTAIDAALNDGFGRSVAISNSIAIVGAAGVDDACPGNPDCDSGSAYIFRRDRGGVDNWGEFLKLTSSDAAESDRFGWSVAISGNVAIVGAPLDDDACPDDPDCNSGSAYLFDVTTGQQLHKLIADDADGNPEGSFYGDFFGASVAISGGVAIVGVFRDDDACSDNPNCDSGSAYVFDVATGQQLHKLTAHDGTAEDFFGSSVAISGGIAIVGSRQHDDAGHNSGSAYMFDVATGQQLDKLNARDAEPADEFGLGVAISSDRIIVGARLVDDACPGEPNCNSGAAYIFAPSDSCEDEDGDGLVTICHIPPGNPENAHTITVGVDAVPAHLAHGDHCGPCEGDSSLLMGDRSDADQEHHSADLDDSGDVGAADLAELLGAWGLNPGHPADLDGDGNVGPLDLALVLGNWGPCE